MKVKNPKGYLYLSWTTIIYMVLMTSFVSGYTLPTVALDGTSTPAPTVTITAPAPYIPSVETPVIPDNFECPLGLPAGSGITTPDSTWMLLCSQCLTTPFPTSTFIASPVPTWDGTGTPPATSTITPTATVTVTPTITPTPTGGVSGLSCSDRDSPNANGDGDYSCEVVGDHLHIEFAYSSGGYAPSWATFFNTTDDMWDGTQYVTMDMHSHILISFSGGDSDKNVRWFFSERFANWPPYGYDLEDNHYGSMGNLDVDYDRTVTALLENDGHSNPTAVGITLSFGDVQQWFGYYDVWASDHVPTPETPTVTPTAEPTLEGSYCAVIHNDGDAGFSWTGITFGDTYCFDIGPYDGFDFGGLTAPAYGAFPWIAHICFQDVDLGTITVFLVSISLSTIAYVLGIMMIIRNMFVS
jgi:hypothetical protein